MNDEDGRDATGEPARPARRCPICSRPAVERYRPFCSKRCADVDLGRWFGERYRVPVEEEPDGSAGEDNEADPGQPPRS